MFQSFSQADDSTTRKYGGTGLGLVISRQLVNLMGGDIRLDSQPGRGSTFSFDIRLPRVDPASVQPAESASSGAAQGFEGQVLVVDDNPVNREVAREMLGHLGLAVDLADGGTAAVEAAARQQYDMIFMDCQMPDMDGSEAVRRIRANEADAHHNRIIALTANILDSDSRRFDPSQMDGYLGKPYTLDQLREVLARWLPVKPLSPATTAGPAAGPSDDGLIDHAALDNMRLIQQPGSPDIVARVIALYLQDSPQQLDQLQQALADSDAGGLARAAHALKSASANLGANALAELCRGLEQQARAGQLDDAAAQVEAIGRLHAEVARRLAEIAEQGPAT